MARITSVTVVSVLLLAGCATKSDIRDLRGEVQEVSERQERLLVAMEALRATALDSMAVQSDVLFSMRGELNRQVLEIQEQLVAIQELTGQGQRALAGLRDQIEARRTAIVEQERAPAAGGGAGGGVAADADPTGPDQRVPGASGVAGDPQQLYNVALSQFNRGSITTARAAFERFLTRFPNNALAPNAHFYLADIQLQENRLEEARDAFLEIAELFPASDRVPPSLYRAAVIEDELGNTDQAVELLERVVNSYPDAGVAVLAQERLDELQ